MKKIKVSFDTWVQLLGMLGVLGGLIFVGLEMRQSQIIAIGNQVQARADTQITLMTTPLDGDQRLLPLLSFASIPNESDLSEEEKNSYTSSSLVQEWLACKPLGSNLILDYCLKMHGDLRRDEYSQYIIVVSFVMFSRMRPSRNS